MMKTISDIFDYGINPGQRTLYLCGEVDDAMAQRALVGLDILGSRAEAVRVVINSTGGDLYAGLAIYDAIRALDCPVTTIATGSAMSAGGIILQAGDIRQATAHATIMYHYQTETIEADSKSFEIWGKFSKRYREMMLKILVERTGHSKKFWETKLAADFVVGAQEAAALKIIDEVISE